MPKNIDPAVAATIRREWDASPSIRKEFRDNFAGYAGFRQAEMNGRFKSAAASRGTVVAAATSASRKPEGRRSPDICSGLSESSEPAGSKSYVRVAPTYGGAESHVVFADPVAQVAMEDRTPAQHLKSRKAYRAFRLDQMDAQNREFFSRVLPPVT